MEERTDYYFGTAKVIGYRAAGEAPDMEHATSRKPLAKKGSARFNSCVDLVIHSFRVRLADSDGISAKAAIDGLVHEGIIEDDSPKYVREVRFIQTKVKNKSDEKTVITITEVE